VLPSASLQKRLALSLPSGLNAATAKLKPEIVDIGQLPLYNQDFDDSGIPPAPWAAFRQLFANFFSFT
jgi:chromate reductase, NAD(P)H dehydrogenase (quinone)